MIKKGKYNLFSFSIENEMIIYNSKNRMKKLVIFNLLMTNNLEKMIPFLNTLLRKGLIKYYSIQFLNKKHLKTLILLNYQDKIKENILKSIDRIKEEIKKSLIKKSLHIEFLTDNELKREFINIILEEDLDKDLKINTRNDFCVIKNNKKIQFIKLYSLYFIQDTLIESILNIFFNLITDLGIKGNLILNFLLKNGNIIFSSFFVKYYYNKNIASKSVETVNEFISNELYLKEKKIKKNMIGYILWRLNFTKNYSDYDKNKGLVFSLCSIINENKKSLVLNGQKSLLSPISKNFMTLLIEFLKRNNIEFNKKDSHLIEIKNQYIILSIDDFNPSIIQDIFQKYYQNRIIYIILHDLLFFKKLVLETKITNLLGVKIFNPISFIKFLKKANSLMIY